MFMSFNFMELKKVFSYFIFLWIIALLPSYVQNTMWLGTSFEKGPIIFMCVLLHFVTSSMLRKRKILSYLKYWTLVASRLRSPSKSRLGSALFKKTTSTSTSSRAGWKKSACNSKPQKTKYVQIPDTHSRNPWYSLFINNLHSSKP